MAAAFFVNFVIRIGGIFARFIFYKGVVKFYKFYTWSIKKLGWSGYGGNRVLSFSGQKFARFSIALLIVVFIFTNLTTPSRADSSADDGRTILADLIKSEFEDPEEDRIIEEFFDEEAFISGTQQSYLENLSAVRMDQVANLNISDEEGGGVFIKPGAADTKKNKQKRADTVYYAVKDGDTISTIASEFAVSVNTILWENNLSAYSVIRPGDSLAILPISGISHKIESGETLASIAQKYGAESDKILETNRLTDSNKLISGQKLIIPGGSKNAYAVAPKKAYSGISVIKDVIGEIIEEKPKTKNASPAAGNKMNWPTVGYRMTQYYSWRHHAVDIANKTGTPLFAADAGVIEYAGWGKGYGNQIVIDHGGGKKTRYAHLSKFYTKKGQEVAKGEVIGAMGSTGRSTGPHLHFEVIINGVKYNPLNYIK